ncbi:saccharopine dehydrogenase family protein [Pseudomonas frederiksbergensis]|uniref:saccharopine dehydrogenase family protein n=1 Tax=Pseudomonas frederiksbergensis TaxID=104087 RepID=UPI003D24088F
MSQARKVLIYGASGYTGKLVAESLAQRNIPFYMAGRSMQRLETALGVVKARHQEDVDAELIVVEHTPEALAKAFAKVDVVINVAGPFMQLAWPVVQACLDSGCHYLDTTGEQDWTDAIGQKYGDAFAAKGLLLCPANSFMWAAGALAAEVVLENPEVDSLDILYQIDNGLPSEASTKSFLRMVCNDTSQYYLEQNELKAWPNDKAYNVALPYRNTILRAHPWGGACEPIWLKTDPRVQNCRVLTAIGEHLIDGVIDAIKAFNAAAPGLSQAEREEWTNNMGNQMDIGEPPKDSVDVQRGVVVCHGQGRQVTHSYVMNLSAAYTWTGEMCAEAALRLLSGKLKMCGFQSAAKAFGHRELISRFHELGYCSALPV